MPERSNEKKGLRRRSSTKNYLLGPEKGPRSAREKVRRRRKQGHTHNMTQVNFFRRCVKELAKPELGGLVQVDQPNKYY